MLKGLLIVNSFLRSSKYSDLYKFFENASIKHGISLTVATSAELMVPVGGNISLQADFVLFWDKDIPLAKQLEGAGFRCYNSSEAILICDDKALTAEALIKAGLQTPRTMIAPKTFSNIGYSNLSFLSYVEEYISYPMIIKHRFGSFGAQVYLAQNRLQAEEILRDAGGNEVLFQEFVSESAGRDLRVNIVGGALKGCILRYNEHDFRSNITAGGSMKAFTPDAETVRCAVDAANAVGAEFAGVDVLFGKDGPIICEVNASPHFKTTYQATGVDLAEEILDDIIGDFK